MPLAFNLFGPLRLDLALATRVLQRLDPDLADITVRVVWFEHSAGRGSPVLTGDHTAFDVFIGYERSNGHTGFLAIEQKYAESMQEPAPDLSPRYDEIARSSGLFIDPTLPALRAPPLRQLYREHLLAQIMLARGNYDEGRFVLIAPRLNYHARNAGGGYNCQINEHSLTTCVSIRGHSSALSRRSGLPANLNTRPNCIFDISIFTASTKHSTPRSQPWMRAPHARDRSRTPARPRS
jgi:hypothetical protein